MNPKILIAVDNSGSISDQELMYAIDQIKSLLNDSKKKKKADKLNGIFVEDMYFTVPKCWNLTKELKKMMK